MKLAFSTNAFTSYPIEEAIAHIGAIGYHGVEILADRPHLYPINSGRKVVDNIKQSLAKSGLKVSNINANTASGYFSQTFMEPVFEPSLSNDDNDLRKWRIEYTKQCVDLAEELGAKNVSITSGRPIPGCPPVKGIENFKRSLDEILVYGENKGISIGIEYEPGLLIESAGETRDLLVDVGSKYLGVNLDIGHAVVGGEEPAEVIRSLCPWLLNIHLEDIKGRKHYHLIPGDGDIDFDQVFKSLEEVEYKGFVTVELYTYCNCPEKAAIKAFQYLKRLDT